MTAMLSRASRRWPSAAIVCASREVMRRSAATVSPA
jgi:hypothetical protein